MAGGKLTNKVFRRTTPYDRPAITNPNPNNTSKLGFLSRLFYAFTCAFWKTNTGANEEQRNTKPNTNDWSLPNISAAEISEFERLLKQKTFTRDEIERLTRLKGDKTTISYDSHVLRLKGSISGPLKRHAEERENVPAVISTPTALEEEVALPVELPKARSYDRSAMYRIGRSPYYRGLPTFSKKPTPSSSQAGKSWSSVLNDPRSGGPMRRTRQKANILPEPSVKLSQPARELEGSNGSKMAGKRRSIFLDDLACGGPRRRTQQKAKFFPMTSVLEGSNGTKMAGKRKSSVLDDLVSGGPIRRTRQKAIFLPTPSVISSQPARELEGSNGSKMAGKRRNLGSGGPIRRIRQKASKAVVENEKTTMPNSGYTFVVPIQSTQMATKILEHIEKTNLKEKPSSSRLAGTTEKSKSSTKPTSNPALRSLDKVESSKILLTQDSQKSEGHQHCIEVNGPLQSAVPLNVLSSIDGNSTAPVPVPEPGNAPTTNSASTLALPVEPKKPAFRISAPEDFEALDDDNHSSAPPVQGNAPTTNPAPTSVLQAEPPQKKPAFQISAPDDSQLFDDDDHLPLLEVSTSLLTGHGEELAPLLVTAC